MGIRQMNPSLIIGLGGKGTSLVNRIKRSIYRNMLNEYGIDNHPLIRYLVIDSEFKSLEREEEEVYLNKTEMLELNVNAEDIQRYIENPEYLECYKDDESCFIDRKIKEVVKVEGEGCGGWPIICRVNGIVNIVELKNKLEVLLRYMSSRDILLESLHKMNLGTKFSLPNDIILQVYIFLSLGGGTGRGLYEIIIPLLRAIFRNLQPVDSDKRLKIRLFNVMPSVLKRLEKSNIPDYVKVNTYTAFREIEHFMNSNTNYSFDYIYKCRLEKLGISTEDVPFADHVYLLSPNDRSGIKFKDYEEFKDFIAEYISESIVLGYMDLLLAKESNLSSMESLSEIVEKETGRKDRARRYGRIAFYKIKYPVEDIAECVANYSVSEVLKDLIEDFLNKEHRDIKALEGIKKEAKEKIRLRSKYGVSLGDIYAYTSPDDDWMGIIENVKSEVGEYYEEVSSYESVRNTAYRNFNNILEELEHILKNFGMKEVSNLLESLHREVSTEIKNELKNILGLPDTSSIVELDKEVEKIKSTIDYEFTSFITFIGEKQNEVNNILYEEKKRFILFRLFNDKISSENLERLRDIFEDISRRANAVIDKINKVKTVIYLYEMKKIIEHTFNIVKYNRDKIHSLSKDYEDKVKDIIFKSYKGYVKKMLLLDISEMDDIFNYFNEKLYSPQTILSELEKSINKKIWIKDIIKYRFDDKSEEIMSSITELANRVKEDVLDYLSKTNLIENFLHLKLKNLSDDWERDTLISHIAKDWLSSGNFLGVLDNFKAGTVHELSEFTNYVVVMPDTNETKTLRKLKEHIEMIPQSQNGFAKIVENPLAERDEVLIIGLQHSIPLFLFEEVHTLKEQYLKINDDRVKIARHSSKDYVLFDEPVGKDTYLAKMSDVIYLLNLAYQLNAIRGDSDKFGEFLKIFYLDGRSPNYKETPVLASSMLEPENISYVVSKVEKAIMDVFGYYLYKAIEGDSKGEPSKISSELLRKFLDTSYIHEGFLTIPAELVNNIKKSEDFYKIFFTEQLKNLAKEFLNKYSRKYNIYEFNNIKEIFGEKLYSSKEKLKKANLVILPEPEEL